MNARDRLITQYSDLMLEIMNADDMDYGDKTGAFMAVVMNIIRDTAMLIRDDIMTTQELTKTNQEYSPTDVLEKASLGIPTGLTIDEIQAEKM